MRQLNLPAGEYSKVAMPSVMDSVNGKVDEWLKIEGEWIAQGENLCEVTLDDLTIGITAPAEGYLSIVAEEGKTVATHKVLAIIAGTSDDYNKFVGIGVDVHGRVDDEAGRAPTVDEAGGEGVVSTGNTTTTATTTNEDAYEEFKVDEAALILRAVKHMMNNGVIDENSDFTKRLRRLIRKKNREVFATFEASFEGEWDDFHPEDNFDAKFFLSGVEDIVEEDMENDHRN